MDRVSFGFDSAHAAFQRQMDKLLADVKIGLPEKLYETAYALACDVAVADGKLSQEELRLLQMLRNTLELDHLHSAAIERGARARHARL
ncbi:MAG: hypothetical protein CFH38_00851 [Alphaproteobacteria bacterium MarineAlpha10_Bin1]|nr:MAG: hypothetical protein CFH38_00851 [Alphaproteobacteria bacterium MarineAlpha10_Bin1]